MTARDPGEVIEGEIVEETEDGGGEVITASGILGGGTLVQVRRPDNADLYFQRYHVEGYGFLYFQFSAEDTDGNGTPDEIEATFGPDNIPTVVRYSEDTYERTLAKGQINLAGEVGRIQGIGGNFDQLWKRTLIENLGASGGFDPSVAGKLANDPEIQAIMAAALISGTPADINQADIMAQVRETDIWKNDVYNGIQFFYDRGDADPEQAWRNYERTLTDGLRTLGETPDPITGNYNAQIGDYLNAGVSAEEFDRFLPVAQTIQNNPGLKAQLDAWAVHEGLGPLDFDQFVDVLEGTNDPELERVVESATLADAAERVGLDVSVEDIRSIAEQTNMTPDEAINAFTQQERTLLSVGEQDLKGFGITKGDFLDLFTQSKPRSGQSAAFVQNVAGQLATERGLSDEANSRFFLGFDRETGAQQRQGLNPLAGRGG